MRTERRTTWRSGSEWAIVDGRVLRPGEAFVGREQDVTVGTDTEIAAEAERRGCVVSGGRESEVTRLRTALAETRAALANLLAVQNGPPLVRESGEWRTAVERAERTLEHLPGGGV